MIDWFMVLVLTLPCTFVLPTLRRLNDSDFMGSHQMENDGFSDKSEREAHEDWDTPVNENGGRLMEESDTEQADDLSPGLQFTAYVEEGLEEMAEVRGWTLALTVLQCPSLLCLLASGGII